MMYTPAKSTRQIVMDHKLVILGLTGKMGVGKDTLAQFLARIYSPQSRITWFAKPLKALMMQYFGFTYDDLYTQAGKARYNPFWEMTNRTALQLIGTECFRMNFRADTWIKTMELDIVKEPTKFILIPDVRFPNEANLIRDLGGKIFRIDRDVPDNDERLTKHSSEVLINQISVDAILNNNSSLEEFFWLGLEAMKTYHLDRRIGATPPDFLPEPGNELESRYWQVYCRFYPMLNADE